MASMETFHRKELLFTQNHKKVTLCHQNNYKLQLQLVYMYMYETPYGIIIRDTRTDIEIMVHKS